MAGRFFKNRSAIQVLRFLDHHLVNVLIEDESLMPTHYSTTFIAVE